MQIPVVDVFAGPGGLGEGFSAFATRRAPKQTVFKIAISAEMESNAAKTLRLRAFFRQFAPGHAPSSYYDYVAGRRAEPWTSKTEQQWIASGEEARQLKLGEPSDDTFLHSRIKKVVKGDQPWVLIGGPPCQAYSLVGRARNQGILGYRAEDDHRHFLYKHYLSIIRKFRPAAFVMENVKGILSSKVGGALVFPQILDDLTSPGGKGGPKYQIVPLVIPSGRTSSPSSKDYILRAEELGVPQARHRVVLLGLAEGYSVNESRRLTPSDDRHGVLEVIGCLPKLRSGVTDAEWDNWGDLAATLLESAADAASGSEQRVERVLRKCAKAASRQKDPGTGGRWMPKTEDSDFVADHLTDWLIDPRLDGILNHEVRSHMCDDLVRYAFASAFADIHGHSPRGAAEFPSALHPDHKNWKSGKFIDRFKVQQGENPSSTVTSHLSKDGHYFIHPDPQQLRSLSVREAARLQTFPDNYFFEGKRGAQFKQVGNAVPPWMARQIAEVVYSSLLG
jgi:DNA (cytosine-5)-methyltransferase 1